MNNVLTLIKYDILGAFNKFTKNKKTILMAVFIIILCTFAFLLPSYNKVYNY